MSQARITIRGNAAEPKQRISQSGKTMLDISVAHTARRKNRDNGEWEDVTDQRGEKVTLWARATFFDDDAHEFARVVGKGDLIELEGEPRPNAYVDNAGNPRASIDIHRAILKIVPRASRNGASRGSTGQGAASQSSDPWSTTQNADTGNGFGDFDEEQPF